MRYKFALKLIWLAMWLSPEVKAGLAGMASVALRKAKEPQK